jgi:hypothetical protein
VANLTDLGNLLTAAMLEAAQDAITHLELQMPGMVGRVGGLGPPTDDPCEGRLWVRVAAQYPSNGDAGQFVQVRADWSIPAWTIPIELGILWCHPVINEDGSSPDPAEWDALAERDGNYRLALLDAAAYRYPAKVRDCAEGHRLEPWSPIGPDDGYSGGLLVSSTVTRALATQGDAAL